MTAPRRTILLVHPDVKVSRPILRQLADDGYIVLRARPGEVSFRGETSDDVVLRMALEGILDGSISSDNHLARIGKTFAKRILVAFPQLPAAGGTK